MGERLRAEFRISEPHRVSPCSCPGHGGRLGFLLFSVGRQRAGCVFSKAVPDVDAWRVCLGRGGGVAGTGRCRLLPGLPGPPPGAQEVNEPSCITVAFCSYQEVWRQGGGNRRPGRLSQAGQLSPSWADAMFPSGAKPVCPLCFFEVGECRASPLKSLPVAESPCHDTILRIPEFLKSPGTNRYDAFTR